MKRVFKKIKPQLAESDDGVRVYCSGRYQWTVEYADRKICLGRDPVEDELGFLSLVSLPTPERRWELLDAAGNERGTEAAHLTANECAQVRQDFEGGLTAIGTRWIYDDEPQIEVF